jgi:hypothetical protein
MEYNREKFLKERDILLQSFFKKPSREFCEYYINRVPNNSDMDILELESEEEAKNVIYTIDLLESIDEYLL